jgi:hypothetical protein
MPKSQLPSTESDLVRLAVQHLYQTIPPGGKIGREIRSHGTARTDIILVTSGEVTSIEVKRTGWRRAIAQALLNRVCTDRSYVALWHTCVTLPVLDEARWHGLGVLSISEEAVEQILEAEPCMPSQTVRRRIVNLVEAANA